MKLALGTMALLLGALVALPNTAAAKARTVRVTLTCTGLAAPIDVTEGPLLAFPVGPWGGRFADTSRSTIAPPADVPGLCEMAFYSEMPNKGARLSYVAFYHYRADGSPGYISLPGPSDPWYALNQGTIIRAERDGRWSYAAADWERVIRTLIARAA
jgi:hypothetical protein